MRLPGAGRRLALLAADDLNDLARRATAFARERVARSARGAYANDWKAFFRCCGAAGRPGERRR